MTNKGRSLDQFRAAHDPTFRVESPTILLSRDLPSAADTFIITAAQNATPVHADFWSVLSHMAGKLDAQRMVIPLRYKNPTSHWTGSQQNADYWDAAVRPYLWNQRHALNKNLTLLADIKTQPTASSPLTGFDAVSLASSGIIGHTKLQLKCVPTPSGRMAKILTTTGACTVPNYTDSKAGKIGEFHHSLSAVLVEVCGKKFHLRHLHYDAKTKSVTDLGVQYFANRSAAAPRPLALIMGDTHVDAICPQVEAATFAPGGMVDSLRPRHLVWHDLLDAYSCNPHHFGNPFNAIAKRVGRADDVRAEVNRAIDFVRAHTPKDCVSVVVASNHDDMLKRWIIKNDWRLDPVNAEFYLETALAMTRGTKLTGNGTVTPDPFAHWFSAAEVPSSRVLDLDESLMLGGVELGMHGDRGANGARGSIKGLRRIGVKSVIGHSHSPGIDEGCTQVGTSTRLKAEYNHGASGWMNAHCWLNADGKRQLNFVIDGEWRRET